MKLMGWHFDEVFEYRSLKSKISVFINAFIKPYKVFRTSFFKKLFLPAPFRIKLHVHSRNICVPKWCARFCLVAWGYSSEQTCSSEAPIYMSNYVCWATSVSSQPPCLRLSSCVSTFLSQNFLFILYSWISHLNPLTRDFLLRRISYCSFPSSLNYIPNTSYMANMSGMFVEWK